MKTNNYFTQLIEEFHVKSALKFIIQIHDFTLWQIKLRLVSRISSNPDCTADSNDMTVMGQKRAIGIVYCNSIQKASRKMIGIFGLQNTRTQTVAL